MSKTLVATMLAILFLCVSGASAYDASTTHALITKATTGLISNLSNDEIDLIKQGSIDEDTSPRYFRHFYDPVNNKGLAKFDSAKEWSLVNKSNVFGWDDALYKYNKNDKQYALRALGQNLHLIEDMTVPDHTRNDTHPQELFGITVDPSPYELYTSRFTATNTDLLVEHPGIAPISLPTLGDYFDQLATYSNNNFYSKDTIESLDYAIINPEIKSETLADGKVHTFAWTRGDDKYRLYEIATSSCKRKGKKTVCEPSKILSEPVLQDYWQRLAPKAVAYSAGVVNLFFQEAEKAKADYAAHEEAGSWFDSLVDKIKDNIEAARKFAAQELRRLARAGDAAGVAEKRNELLGLAMLSASTASTSRNVERIEKQIEAGRLSMWDYLKLGLAEGEQLISTIRAFAATHEDLAGLLLNFDDQATSTPPTAPVITIPTGEQLAGTFATSTIEFAGSADPGTVIINSFDTAFASTTASGTWSLILADLPEGTTTLLFFAIDEAGSSTPATVTISVKIEPQQLPLGFTSFAATECADSIVPNACVIGSNGANLIWETNQPAAYYDVFASYRDYPNEFSLGTTTEKTRYDQFGWFTYGDYFVVAYGLDGQVATSSMIRVENNQEPLMVSEVAWRGTAATSADKWIELYNTSAGVLDLSRVYLRSGDGTLDLPLSGSVAAGDYYLIELGDDNVVSNIAADLVVGARLPDTYQVLKLVYKKPDGTELEWFVASDDTPACQRNDTTCAPESPDYHASVETNQFDSGELDYNDQAVAQNGLDRSGGLINGSVKMKNSNSRSFDSY